MPFVTDEVVTAAKLNMATSITGDTDLGSRTFTNTTYADLDALTGGAGTLTAVSVSVTTGSLAIVTFSAGLANSAGVTLYAFRVSGATTIAATDNVSVRHGTASSVTGCLSLPVTLTAGVNVFEVQARVTAGTGTILSPSLVVQTVI